MRKFKKGDYVVRISYGKDVIFEITKIVKTSNQKQFAILKGISERIVADSDLEDLELIEKRILDNCIKEIDEKLLIRIDKYKKKWHKEEIETASKRGIKYVYTGKILHLDGDKRYTEKSIRYYKSLGLNAVVKNVPENKQPFLINELLKRYKPDIVVITGHDGMIKKGTGFNDIYNYRNSRHFINTVDEARKWARTEKRDLAIFAGACQSYYEAIMAAGANFASSPARIMIDFIDPLIVAERIATTESTQYLTIEDIQDELRDGQKGVSGIGAIGKRKTKLE